MEEVGAGFWRPFDTSRPPPVKSEPSTATDLTWDLSPPCLSYVAAPSASTPSDQLSAPRISPVVSPLSIGMVYRSQSESPETAVLPAKKTSETKRKRSKRSARGDQQMSVSASSGHRRRGRTICDNEKKVGVVQGLPRKESTPSGDECGGSANPASTNVPSTMTSSLLNLSDSVVNSNNSPGNNNNNNTTNSSSSGATNNSIPSIQHSSDPGVVMESPRSATINASTNASYNSFPTSPYVQSWPQFTFGGHSYMAFSPVFGFGEIGDTLPPAAHQHSTMAASPHPLLAPAFHSSPLAPPGTLPPTPSPSTTGTSSAPLKSLLISRACSPFPPPPHASIGVQTEHCTCWRCADGDSIPTASLAPLLISPDSTAVALPSPKAASPGADALNTLYQVAQTILGEAEANVEHGNCVTDLHGVRYDMARTTELPAPGAVSHFPQLEGIQEWERGTLRQMSAIQSRVREVKSLIRKKKRYPSSASSGGASSTKVTSVGTCLPPPLQPASTEEVPPQQQENLRLLASCALEMRASNESEDVKEEPPTLTAVSEAEKPRDTPPVVELPPMMKPSLRGDHSMPELSLSVDANNPPLLLPSPTSVVRKRGHTHDGSLTERRKRPRREKDEETKEEVVEEKKVSLEKEEKEEKIVEACSPVTSEDSDSKALLHLDAKLAENGDRIIFLMGKLKTGHLTILAERESFGLVFDCDRGGGPHQILSAAELGNMVIREVKPESDELPKETRVCAYWSKYQSHLYPGNIAAPDDDEPTKPGPGFVYISFDDQFCGWIELGHVRLLPSDFPVFPSSEDDMAIGLPLGRRRARSGDAGSILREDEDEETRKEKKYSESEERDEDVPLVIVELPPVPETQPTESTEKTEVITTTQKEKEEDEEEEEEEETNKKKKKKKKKKKRRVTWRWADSGQRKGGKIFYKSVERSQDGEKVKVGDAVLFSSGEERPYLGQVHAMFENADAPGNPMYVCATWYYQPREMGDAVESSLKTLKSAVFSSKHADENDARTILRKIRVLPNYSTYKKYRRKAKSANKAGRPGGSMKDVYFCAGRFDPLAKRVLQYDQTLKRMYMERKREEGKTSSCSSSAASSCSSVASSSSSLSADAQWAVARALTEADRKEDRKSVKEKNNNEEKMDIDKRKE